MRNGVRLADVGPGERFVVRRILFEGLRAQCGAQGVWAGEVVEVVERDDARMLLRVGAGRVLRCPSSVASFVEVERVVWGDGAGRGSGVKAVMR
ncbi:MAG TPA: ferrous iron transport protein A [Longimicrobiales bacterium]|nr:ferrous iron transport protein A [Longimicrobiales bacterium]